jgi:hypothetical protein
MKSVLYFLGLYFCFNILCYAQDISFIPDKVYIKDTLGKEIVFNCKIKNISAMQQTVFMVRKKATLPGSWTSSLCFGECCFPCTLDSVATTPDFNSTPFSPQEEREASLHVFTSCLTSGIACVTVEVGTIRNPNSRISLEFTAESYPTSINDKYNVVNNYNLDQNYPNPFNPDTKISYQLKERGYVKLMVFDLKGDLIKVLVNETKDPGYYDTEFSGKGLASGVYMYRIEIYSKANNLLYSNSKKTILLK